MITSITETLPLPQIYYDHVGRLYWVQDNRGVWIRFTEEAVKRHLGTLGYSRQRDGDGQSPADLCLHRIQLTQNVDYAGGLAGHISGFREVNGSRMLVTESPKLIESRPGAFPLLETILEGMLVEGGIDQRPYFFGWMKLAMQCYRRHSWASGQALALAGPIGAGKSLLQGILTECFGGRAADAYLYVAGRSNFNSEMFRTEHLMLEDKSESTRHDARAEMACRIKEITANPTQHCHGKNREGLQLDPIWRLSISLNDLPERMMVLPPLDEDIADKIILLKVTRRAMPMPAGTDAEKKAFREAVTRELPAFLHFLEQWEIPPQLRGDRFPIRHFHHPELLAMLEANSQEIRLLNLIDRELFPGARALSPYEQSLGQVLPGPQPWDGRALTLEQRLKSDTSSVRREAEQLFSFGSACGTFLGRLRVRRPGRVSGRVLHGENVWTIQPPQHLVGAASVVAGQNNE